MWLDHIHLYLLHEVCLPVSAIDLTDSYLLRNRHMFMMSRTILIRCLPKSLTRSRISTPSYCVIISLSFDLHVQTRIRSKSSAGDARKIHSESFYRSEEHKWKSSHRRSRLCIIPSLPFCQRNLTLVSCLYSVEAHLPLDNLFIPQFRKKSFPTPVPWRLSRIWRIPQSQSCVYRKGSRTHALELHLICGLTVSIV